MASQSPPLLFPTSVRTTPRTCYNPALTANRLGSRLNKLCRLPEARESLTVAGRDLRIARWLRTLDVSRKETVALEDRKDFYTIAPDSVDDSVTALEHLANVVATELGNPATSHGRASRTCGSHQHANPPRSCNGIISGNEVADRLEIGERPISPDDGDRLG